MIEAWLLVGAVATQGLSLAAIRASEGLRRRGWVVVAFVLMGLSVMSMSRAIARGLPLAVGYGVWSGSGIVLAATAGAVVFGDRLTRTHLLGLALVMLGVAVVYAAGA